LRCPLCDSKTKVTVTRSGPNTKGYAMVRHVSEAVNPFTSDWVARTRACPSPTCGWSATTAELYLDDLLRGWVRKDPHIRKLLRGRKK